MNTMTRMMITTLALGAAALAAAGNLPDIKVPFSQQELANPAKAVAFYGRLTTAAQQSCSQLNGAELARRHNYQACVGKLLAKAVRDVRSPALAAVHEARTGEHIDVNALAVRLAAGTRANGMYAR